MRGISTRRCLAAFALVGVASVSRSAWADNKNPNVIPLGENESFLGNTGVGRANDSGAVYYNPSGLAELPTGRVSVSGAVYTSVSQHFDSFLTLDNTQVPLDASAFVTIPSAYAATRRMGDWVGAFSVLVPDSIAYDDHVLITTPAHQADLTYSAAESELWLGLSLARKLGERWSVGATVFGINHSSTIIVGTDVRSTATPTDFATSIGRQSLSTWVAVATLGATYVPADWIRLGLRAQTTSVQMAGSADTFETVHNSAAPNENLKGTRANYVKPFDFSLGTAVTPAPWVTLLLDGSLQLGASYTTIPASAAFSEDISLKPTPRINAGAEFWPTPTIPLRVGFFVNPSAEGHDRSSSSYQPDDYFGITAGVGLNDEHVRSSIGGFYIWSNGATSDNGVISAERIVMKGLMLTTAYVF